jgi:hypothetical protein
MKVKDSTITLLTLFHRSFWTGNKLKYPMKKAISICFLILLVYACSKTDDRQKETLKCECAGYLTPSEPVACSGTLCQSDTCQTYFTIWKDLLMSRNQMSKDYFDNHITPCNTSIDKWDDGISFRIYYKVKIEWAEILLGDQFIIRLSPSTSGLYPSLSLPRDTLLTKDQINSAFSLMAFSSSMNTISSINELKYHSLTEALNAVIRGSGVDTLCTSDLYYDPPQMDLAESGQPYIRAYGILNWNENKCITSQMNLYTGEVKVIFNQCMIIFCVTRGTLVTKSNNSTLPIEKIKPGDTILSVNTNSMKIEKDLVQKIDSVTHKDIIDIIFSDNTKLSSTWDHPYYVKSKGWCSYKPQETLQKYGIMTNQLKIGDICIKYHENILTEVKVRSLSENRGDVKTYNISRLKKNTSYFANGILISTEEN